jgi:PAS domain S-box-containing protein
MKTYRVLSGGRESTSADALPAATQPATFLRMAGKETSLGLRQVAELKKVEEKLRESKDLLQSVFDTSTNILSVCKSVRNDGQEIVDFAFILTNTACRAFFGQELAGKNALQVFPNLRTAGIFDMYKKVVETGIPLDTEVFYNYDGLNNWFRLAATRLPDGIMLSMKDITQRKLSELEARRQAGLLKTITDTAFGGMALLEAIRDEAGQITDFRYAFANPVKAAFLGLPLSELIGNTLQTLFPAVKQSGMWERLLQVMESGQTTRNLEEWHRAGNTIMIDQQYVKVEDGVLAWDKDVTLEKKAEQAVHEKAEQFRTLVEHTPDAISRWNQSLQLTYANPVYAERTGRPLASLMGKTALEGGLPEAQAGPWMDKLHLVFRTGVPQEHFNLHPLPAGTRYYYSRLVPELAADGRVQSVLAIARDITDIKLLEEESLRLKLNQQKELLLAILEAQENERKRIAEGLHNGLGQILYAAKLHLDQFRSALPAASPGQGEGWKKVDQLLVEAIDQTRRISHELIPTTLEDLGLEAAIRDICCKFTNQNLDFQCWVFNMVRPLEKHLQLAIYRIAQELANNIIKHAGATEASIILREEKDFIILQGEDNGQGFDPCQEQPAGLGLKSIRDRVKLLNGTMEIDAGPGKGTLISIYLPRSLARWS